MSKKPLTLPFSGSTENCAPGKWKIKTGNIKVREPGNRRSNLLEIRRRHSIRPREPEVHRANAWCPLRRFPRGKRAGDEATNYLLCLFKKLYWEATGRYGKSQLQVPRKQSQRKYKTIANSRKNKIIQGGKCSQSIQFGSMVNKTYTVIIKHWIRLTKKCVTKIDGKRIVKAGGLKLNTHLP